MWLSRQSDNAELLEHNSLFSIQSPVCDLDSSFMAAVNISLEFQ